MIPLSNKSVFEQPSRTKCVRKPRFDCTNYCSASLLVADNLAASVENVRFDGQNAAFYICLDLGFEPHRNISKPW